MVDKKDINPLDELFTDSQSQIDPAVLASLIKPFARIQRESGKVLFTPAGMKLSANNKIIIFLLARKVLAIQKIVDSDAVAPKEIKAELGKNIPAGTIDPALKRLSERGPLKGQDGKYFVPDFNFSQVEEIFSRVNN